MKRSFLFLLSATLMLAACKGKQTYTHTEKNEDGSTTTTSVDVSKMADQSDAMNKKVEELKKLTPLTLDQLKAVLPEEVAGVKRSGFNANSTMGYSVAEAEYRKDDSSEVKVFVYDCSGEAGSGMYVLGYWTQMNFQQESDKGYTKTIDFNGNKAVEQYDKDSNEYKLTYMANDRLLVTVTSRNMGDAKDIAKSLNLKA